MRKISKKADLSLSTNAIVVMIIAITILGLALTFTRGIFDKLGGTINKIGDQTVVDNPPTYDKPLTLNNERLSIRLGQRVDLGVGFFNKYDGERDVALTLESCANEDGGSESDFSFLATEKLGVDVNEAVGFSTSISALKDSAQIGLYICSIVSTTDMGETESKDITIEVK
jgi:hypothetical protein